MYDIVVGRNKQDTEKYGTEGTIYLGKHYVKMGRTTSLSNKVYMDMVRAHVVFICGKRGGGKSYTMGVVAEGMADLPKHIKQNLSIIMLDTMGIYWTMKYANLKDKKLLKEWGLEGKPLDVNIFTPTGFFNKFKDEGIPTDHAFAIRPSELNGSDWNMTFGLDSTSPEGVLIEGTIHDLSEEKDQDYSMEDIVARIRVAKGITETTRSAVLNHYRNADNWGLFSEEGTQLKDLAKAGQVTILDVSCYATEENGWNIKSLVIGLVAQKLFNQRMIARKDEEFQQVHEKTTLIESEEKQDYPLVWLVIDEAHEFMPLTGKT
ncbi:ATP-binding protein, partial [Candidatus Woesearchaeota archaeon]|nr:ATP-binding protein [Candidatus Woesearchaeota archaeon]